MPAVQVILQILGKVAGSVVGKQARSFCENNSAFSFYAKAVLLYNYPNKYIRRRIMGINSVKLMLLRFLKMNTVSEFLKE
jgi:hypothetical protein